MDSSGKRGSFLRPVSPKLLEIGPEVCAVFVILDTDKCHAGARHFLHRRADIFGEALLAPGDAGREPIEGAALAAVDAVERRAEFDFGVLPNFVAGGARSSDK
jgi:hypothetical protein